MHPKGLVGSAANVRSHDPIRLGLGFWQNLSVASRTLISKPFNEGLVVVTKVRDWERSHVK